MSTYPKWSTPNRQALLVKLFLDSGGFCIFGHKNCQIPEHHYEVFIEGLGMSGLKLQPFAKVKIASSWLRLYVDLGDSLKATSKNRKRF